MSLSSQDWVFVIPTGGDRLSDHHVNDARSVRTMPVNKPFRSDVDEVHVGLFTFTATSV
jgi:hypothetical protein